MGLGEYRWFRREGWFQSLGRDSVGWDYPLPGAGRPGGGVSIPRSGFCGVGLFPLSSPQLLLLCFNPSVGILWGGTIFAEGFRGSPLTVSIPRSGFCGVGPTMSPCCTIVLSRFNPSVGILWGGTSHPWAAKTARWCFNPSVGILWGGTTSVLCPLCMICFVFQSLGRDSVGWDQRFVFSEGCPGFGFNPSVGILWGGTPRQSRSTRNQAGFQSLGRDSVGWDSPNIPRRLRCLTVSIPRSGFCGVGLCKVH